MSKKAAFIIAGVITSIVMVLVLGVAGGAHWFDQQASAASAEDPSTTATSAGYVNPADVAALQVQLADYQAALQEANTQLQAAYDQIAVLQTQGRFSGEHESGEHESGEHEEDEHGDRFSNPFEDD